MIFQWPAAQQANVITLAGPMPLSLPSTMLLAPGHHVIVGFAFWNTGAAPVNGRHFHGRELPALFSALERYDTRAVRAARRPPGIPAIALFQLRDRRGSLHSAEC